MLLFDGSRYWVLVGPEGLSFLFGGKLPHSEFPDDTTISSQGCEANVNLISAGLGLSLCNLQGTNQLAQITGFLERPLLTAYVAALDICLL